MNSRRAGVVAIVFIFVLCCFWMFSAAFPQATNVFSSDKLTLKHRAQGVEHFYSGETMLPSPCAGLGISSTIEPQTNAAQVEMRVQQLPGTSCPPKNTTHTFSFSLRADRAPASVLLTLDGTSIPVKVVEE